MGTTPGCRDGTADGSQAAKRPTGDCEFYELSRLDEQLQTSRIRAGTGLTPLFGLLTVFGSRFGVAARQAHQIVGCQGKGGL